MRISNDRILTSHVGSLPRPQELLELLEAAETKGDVDPGLVEARIAKAIDDIVGAQRSAGVDIVNDGENSKTSYTLYVQDRLNGVGPVPPEEERPKSAQHADLMEHQDLVEIMAKKTIGLSWFDRAAPPAATGAVSYGNRFFVDRDLRNLKNVL